MVKRYRWHDDGMWCIEPGEVPPTAQWVRAEDFDRVVCKQHAIKAQKATHTTMTCEAGFEYSVYHATDYDTLLAERDSLLKDARRYAYLRTELSAVQSLSSTFEISFMLRKNGKFSFNATGLDAYLDALIDHDAAIDAASKP